MCDKLGIENYCTYPSKSWTFGDVIDDDVGKILIMDYIWHKK